MIFVIEMNLRVFLRKEGIFFFNIVWVGSFFKELLIYKEVRFYGISYEYI